MNHTSLPNFFTVDVEDWFHILGPGCALPMSEWDSLEPRVVANTRRILDLMDMHGTKKGTFFVLGWVAERNPDLVREIARRGHEVASHGYGHQLIFEQSRREFRDDIRTSKRLLEDLAGAAVTGYRAPGFSLVRDTLWALDELLEAGFTYDSSLFPTKRGHGGIPGGPTRPHMMLTEGGQRIVEFPISMVNIGPRMWPFSGGGYLRASPNWLIDYGVRQSQKNDTPVVFYLHPREIDVEQPRLVGLPWRRRLTYYHGLGTTTEKVERLLRGCSFQPMGSFAPLVSVNARSGEMGRTVVGTLQIVD